MAKTQLKICGITRAQDVIFCCRHGVDIIDFVTEYPVPVAWDLTRDQTERLMANVTGGTKTCIVTGGSRDKILTLAKKLRPDYIQLQEHETLVDASVIAKTLLPEGIKVIKAIPADPFERMIQFATMDPARCARLLNETQVAAVLTGCHFSSADPKGHKLAEPEFFRQIQENLTLPLILAGGITPDSVRSILKEMHPDILDVMSGMEIRPGVKDTDQIEKLGKILRKIDG